MKTASDRPESYRAILLRETTLGELKPGDIFVPYKAVTMDRIIQSFSTQSEMRVGVVTGGPIRPPADPSFRVWQVTIMTMKPSKPAGGSRA